MGFKLSFLYLYFWFGFLISLFNQMLRPGNIICEESALAVGSAKESGLLAGGAHMTRATRLPTAVFTWALGFLRTWVLRG